MADMPEEESFISHLIELRTRLIRALIGVGIVFLCLMPFSAQIYDLLAAPMMAALPQGTKMIATGVVAPFFVPLKVTLMAGFLIALPWVLWQIWAFVAPGLYAHEKRLAGPLIVASTALFFTGMAFCYFFVFRTVFKFIAGFSPKSILPAPDIEQYLSFVMTMFLAFGITFEVPIAVILLVKAGLVSIAKLKEIRSYVIVAAFVIAAVVTPPDVSSQIMLAVPMCVLYEIGIFVARFVAPKEEPVEQA
ncbi:twin-arginine translocase subunit TatC [Niveibacterium terrae]|uniref:twin-arginine translocase subunit TatC n=1 Tax=Niveibacterium terrae TaxID=3373598 RepID=UPI003A90621F